jgi:putative metallohydrolase (TIGR04338 family)
MPRPRDNQRSRLYAAEWECFGWPTMEFKTMTDAEAYIWKVLSNWRVQKKYPVARDIVSGRIPLKISKGDGSRKAWARILPEKMWVSFPRKFRNKHTILHELAHLLTPADVQEHGREFCRTYQHLVLLFFGQEKLKQLKAAMKKHNCKYSKRHTPYKRPLTQLEKDVMLARLMKNNYGNKSQVEHAQHHALLHAHR